MDIEKLLALFPQANLGEKQAGVILKSNAEYGRII